MKEAFDIDVLDGYQFQDLVAKIMKKRGYRDIDVQQKSGDFGKDIIMIGSNNERIIVECKHQKFVGRPVVQKLQGAMNHEEMKYPNSEVKGIVVTSGKFSPEATSYAKDFDTLELIDGNDLKRICKELEISIFNGKVQIITKESFRNLTEDESRKSSLSNYSKIIGSELNKPKVSADVTFLPSCYLKYKIDFETYSSVGRLFDRYHDEDNLIFDGQTGKDLREDLIDFYFSDGISKANIEDKYKLKRVPFEFTQNDIEEHILDRAIKEHTHTVSYTGNNNVTYTKVCKPTTRDIDIKDFIPIYMPKWSNDLKIKNYSYHQDFFVKDHKKLYEKDELRKCKICEAQKSNYEDMAVCVHCARITCGWHTKIDYLDKKTPVCTIDAKPLKLYLQNKYFAYNDNLQKYKKWWESQSFFKKVYEDKIVFGISIGTVVLLITWILSVTH